MNFPATITAPAPAKTEPLPSLFALDRGTASTIEMLASAAAATFVRQVEVAEGLLRNSQHDNGYRATCAAELADARARLETARRYESAAGRRRRAALTEAERVVMDEARTADPGIKGSALDRLLRVETPDPLDVAGERLDAAAAAFEALCQKPADEEVFGQAEAAFRDAREEYRRLVAERVGQDVDAITARLVS